MLVYARTFYTFVSKRLTAVYNAYHIFLSKRDFFIPTIIFPMCNNLKSQEVKKKKEKKKRRSKEEKLLELQNMSQI